jgi:hypothetical protein
VSRSPAFGVPETYGSIAKKASFNFEELKKLYGENVSSLGDVSKVFVKYLKGAIKKFPFSEGCL